MPPSALSSQRSRRDRCPGVFRPWPADDGGLVRLRLIGGRLSGESLRALSGIAREYGDGDIHLTGRANLQLRAMSAPDGVLPADVVDAIEATGLLPSRTHELVRNVMVSPLSGITGGRADLRPVSDELDRLVCADAVLAGLPGRFLFVLDDGRGDLVGRTCDLGMVALDEADVQLRIGAGWGSVVPLEQAAAELVELARRFLATRGGGEDAPWHVQELPDALVPAVDADSRTEVRLLPLAFGPVPGATHVEVPHGVLDPELASLLAVHDQLVVTPWRGVVVPDGEIG